ncbi:2-oxoacid:acceptor oxidoreductase family protein [Crateriforma conspicua]|uniref:Pyruvate-flavodoxin oxidoreductase n=1 Tax=Crateriforma conspicua TaxID=2527996 RepID=A0A5C5Y335_9PLAN|nr:2-oxoacid:acceptor oxidoreductase family protein [Crateriforma conspicua]TWT69113.1 Pyruvate-flavodoxin oxidoreductase [Crateriforma conspicua]
MSDQKNQAGTVKYPGIRVAMDGNTAVSMCERESTDAAGAYPITPSTQMGEAWAENAAKGHINISGRPLIFIEPEGEHAAAAVTAGLSMTGLRSSNFSSGQGIAYMHESLYAAVGKRLTYVLNVGARAMTKSTLNVHAGHDDYHCMDDTGFFQLFAKDGQSAADLNIISHRIAELSLTPGAIAQDGFLTTHLIESIKVPERALIAEYLGLPEDIIQTPTAAQRIIYGETRRRIPELWDVDNPVMSGTVQNQDAYMQSVAAQRPYFFDHIRDLSERAFKEFYNLTGRLYERVTTYRAEDAEYLIMGQGSMIPTAEVVADYLRETRGIRVGVVNLLMFRPFPTDLVGKILKGRKGVTILERLDQPLAVDLPIMREVRATISRCMENGREPDRPPFPQCASYQHMNDAPPLYSGSFGMGSRDLQPEGIIGAVENMIDNGAKRKFFYLSIDFLRENPVSPKQRIHQEAILDAYPEIGELAIRGSENPNLMPKGAVTVRMHSVGGWGAITTGKNLALTLFELLGYHIKANPKYGSEKKGQPTTFFLSAAPEPIRVNSEYFYVDCVLSPDPNVFGHTNALAGLKEGGVFIIQSDKTSTDAVWKSIPEPYRRIIVDKDIQLYYLDAFKIAREEASDPDLQLRMQGNAFQGAFFAASGVGQGAGLSEEQMLEAIEAQIEKKFGAKGARIVNENIRVVKRGFVEVKAVPHGDVDVNGDANGAKREPALPIVLRKEPKGRQPLTDIHRFWEETGNFYARGQGNDGIADPFAGLGTMPALTSMFRDMTGIRFHHPQWVAENCTACGRCYTVCPDSAIPGLVNEVTQVFDTIVARVRQHGNDLQHLGGAVRVVEQNLRSIFAEAEESDNVTGMLDEAIGKTIRDSKLEGEQREGLKRELQMFRDELGEFQFALSRPYFTMKEKEAQGEGGLLSITVNPYTCKGCMECVEVCDDNALVSVPQTEESIQTLRDNWDLWEALPNTPQKYVRVDDIEEGVGALETILLDKGNYMALASGDGACLGCGEKSVVHIFTATVEALMQPRVKKHMQKLDDLISALQARIKEKLVSEIDLGNTDSFAQIIDDISGGDLTLAGIAQQVEKQRGGDPIDQDWLRQVTKLIGDLKDLKWKYTEGVTGRGRSNAGMLNATGCSSVWGSTYPYNPYPFPWANHLFQDAASISMGIFEGHMAKMADGFKTIRMAEAELAGKPIDPSTLTYFNWEAFTDEEWQLCPPVVSVGGDGAMYDIGFQNLSRALMSGKPIKVLVLDTQVYSNTGGQACTSGFMGQISDMAQFGKATQGKSEIRKEIGLIGMAHRTAYVLQSSVANPNHMIEGFIEGLKTRRPALFNLYTPCQPEHGIGDDMSAHQAKMAVESRAYPIFKYDPDQGVTPEECFDLEGNPSIKQTWPTYTLKYHENGRSKSMELPMTFADFAATEIRFRKHYRVAPPETWNDNMILLADYLELDADDREGMFPYIWSVDREGNLMRLLVAQPIVGSCEDRRDFWAMLKSIARVGESVIDRTAIEAEVRQEVSGRLAQGILQLISGDASSAAPAIDVPAATSTAPAPTKAESNGSAAESNGSGSYMAPWIDSAQCTACDECVNLNPDIFVYNDQKKAVIKNPQGGPYRDLVKAAERCTAQVIHPGLPKDRSEKDIDKWIARGEKYNG